MNYPELPDRSDIPLYTAEDMRRYASQAVMLYKNSTANTSVLLADIKVKDSTIRTLQVELLKYRNHPHQESELITLRRRVAELEKQNSDYRWTIYPDRMGS